MFWRETQRLKDIFDGTKLRVEKVTDEVFGPNNHGHIMFLSHEPPEDIKTTSKATGLSWGRHCGQWAWLVQLSWIRNPHKKHGFIGREKKSVFRVCGVCGRGTKKAGWRHVWPIL